MLVNAMQSRYPFITDVHEWLHERRRFSNIRHPIRKAEFENKILNQVCNALGCAVFVKGASPYPTTDQILEQPGYLLSYVSELSKSYASSHQLKVDLKKSWLIPDDRQNFKEKLNALLNEFECSTSKFGEPVSILSIVTHG